MIAVIYDEIGVVGANCHTAMPACGASPSSAKVSFGSLGVGVGEFETTVHFSGATTVKEYGDLISGCSKTGKTRRASGTSNWE